MIVVPQVVFRGQHVALGEELPPIRLVRELVARGATEVSLLDLDGVVANDLLPQWVQSIVAVAGVPLRFDGQVHDGARVERLARAKLSTIVVDQSAVFDPILLRWALDVCGDRLAVELQADGEYLFDAPPDHFGCELRAVVSDLHLRGVRRIVYRDVTAGVLPLQRLLELCNHAPAMRFTYAGQLPDLDAVAELAAVGAGIEAGIVAASHVLSGGLDLAAANKAAATRDIGGG